MSQSNEITQYQQQSETPDQEMQVRTYRSKHRVLQVQMDTTEGSKISIPLFDLIDIKITDGECSRRIIAGYPSVNFMAKKYPITPKQES